MCVIYVVMVSMVRVMVVLGVILFSYFGGLIG